MPVARGHSFSARRCREPGIWGRFIPWTNLSVGRWSNDTVSPAGDSNSRRRRIEIRVVSRCPLGSKDFFDAERNRRFEWVNCGICTRCWLELHRRLLSFKLKLQASSIDKIRKVVVGIVAVPTC